MVDIRGMAPLVEVFDMPTSLGFYRDVLGFQVVASSGPGDRAGWVLLRRGGVELMLNTAYDEGQRPAAPDPSRVSAHRDTALFFGCPDVEAAYEYLLSKGLRPDKPSVAPYGMKQLYLLDPDGYNLCFQWPASEESPQRYGSGT